MSRFKLVPDYFHRRSWNETWDYPRIGVTIGIEKEFPTLTQFYFPLELNYVPWNTITFTRDNYWIGPFISVLYLIFVWVAPKVMENRKPYDLKTPLKYWNLLLAIFSFWGSIRMIPHLAVFIYKYGFLTTLCVPPIWSYATGPAGFWLMLFVYSKYLELFDTVFIILRKKNLSFLHWYHHFTVLLYTWDGYIGEQAPGIHFCAMNYAIHTIMYFYYYLAAARSKPPSWGIIITVLQITQMVLGVTIGCVGLYLSYAYQFISHSTLETAFKPFDIPGCYINKSNLFMGMAMYSTYFYLFVAFFCARYVSSKTFRAPPKEVLKKRE